MRIDKSWFIRSTAFKNLYIRVKYPLLRRGEEALQRGAHPVGGETQRSGVQFVLPPWLEALLPELVRRRPALGAAALPRNSGARRVDPQRQRRPVRDDGAAQQAWRASRPLRGLPTLPPRAEHAELRRLPPLRGWHAVLLARWRGRGFRRDVHPQCQERHGRGPHHLLLRHREYIDRTFIQNPQLHWRRLAEASVIAKHQLGDLKLALQMADKLSSQPASVEMPRWARDIQFILLGNMNEFETAIAIIVALLQSDAINDPDELHFLQEKLLYFQQKLSEFQQKGVTEAES